MPASNVNSRFDADKHRIQERLRENPLPLGDALQLHADTLRFGCVGFGSEARAGAMAEGIAVLLEAAIDQRSTLDAIAASRNKTKIDQALFLIGNVDHSVGNGANSAKARGDLLNSIRDLLQA